MCRRVRRGVPGAGIAARAASVRARDSRAASACGATESAGDCRGCEHGFGCLRDRGASAVVDGCGARERVDPRRDSPVELCRVARVHVVRPLFGLRVRRDEGTFPARLSRASPGHVCRRAARVGQAAREGGRWHRRGPGRAARPRERLGFRGDGRGLRAPRLQVPRAAPAPRDGLRESPPRLVSLARAPVVAWDDVVARVRTSTPLSLRVAPSARSLLWRPS